MADHLFDAVLKDFESIPNDQLGETLKAYLTATHVDSGWEGWTVQDKVSILAFLTDMILFHKNTRY